MSPYKVYLLDTHKKREYLGKKKSLLVQIVFEL